MDGTKLPNRLTAGGEDRFGNDEIERFTKAGQSIIPYRILVGLDVTTREEEEARKKTEA